jgi:uncharacterized protein
MRFEWEEAKNLSNQRRHGVSFEQASAVFHDPLYVSVQDRIEDGEPRWQTLGMVGELLLLTVAHRKRKERRWCGGRSHSHHFGPTRYPKRETTL